MAKRFANRILVMEPNLSFQREYPSNIDQAVRNEATSRRYNDLLLEKYLGFYRNKFLIGLFDFEQKNLHPNYGFNLGDTTQTLATIVFWKRFLEKFYKTKFDFRTFVRLIETNQLADFHFVGLARDNMSQVASRYPKKIFTVVHGWFMHPYATDKGKKIYDWPPHPNIHPHFVSIYLDKESLVSDHVDYFRRYEPIGCRDRFTLSLFKRRGLQAYVSGCLTLLLTPDDLDLKVTRDPAAKFNVDDSTCRDRTYRFLTNSDRDLSIENNLSRLQLLSRASQVTTSRLHVYLPCRSLGIPVRLKCAQSDRRRFEGLSSVAKFNLRYFRHLLLKTVNCVANGLIKERPKGSQIRLKRLTVEALHLLICVDQGVLEQIFVLLSSVKTWTDRQVYCHLFFNSERIQRQALEKKIGLLERFFEGLALFTYDVRGHPLTSQLEQRYQGLNHVTATTMYRILAPDVLGQIGKVLYLDLDVVLNGDITALYSLRLDANSGLALRKSNDVKTVQKWTKGEIKSDSYNCGVILMDLDRLRRQKFTQLCHQSFSDTGYNDQILISRYLEGREVGTLSPGQNRYLNQESASAGDLVYHFCGSNKPWKSDFRVKEGNRHPHQLYRYYQGWQELLEKQLVLKEKLIQNLSTSRS
jgi:hypothetical protein